MRGKEASKMAVNGVWGGVRKRIRKAVKVFNYKVVPGGSVVPHLVQGLEV